MSPEMGRARQLNQRMEAPVRLRGGEFFCFEHFFTRPALPPPWGCRGAVLLNSAVHCELRSGRRRGLADGVTAVPAAVTDRGVGHLIPASF